MLERGDLSKEGHRGRPAALTCWRTQAWGCPPCSGDLSCLCSALGLYPYPGMVWKWGPGTAPQLDWLPRVRSLAQNCLEPKPIGVPMESWRRRGRGRALHPQGDAPGHLRPEHPPGPFPQEFDSQGPAPAGHSAFLLHGLVFLCLIGSLHSRVSGATCHRALLTDCGRPVTTPWAAPPGHPGHTPQRCRVPVEQTLRSRDPASSAPRALGPQA